MASKFGKWWRKNRGKVIGGGLAAGAVLLTGGTALAALGAVPSGIGAGSVFDSQNNGSSRPPEVASEASNPVANQIAPINFASIFDELTKDQLDIVRNNDGQLQLRFGNNNQRVDLETPVSAGSINTQLPALRNIDSRAVEVVALSQAMTNLGNTIEEMERTSPYLIEQNQALINSFKDASTKAIERGFDFKQNSIDQRLKKAGLDNSSTAFGVQVALAREKANAYVERELSEANLAQGLKQQTIANLHQRSDQIGQNAAIEQNRFNSERAIEAQNEQMRQDQAARQAALDLQANQQRIDTDFANRAMVDQRRQRMAELGMNMFNQGNQQSISAQHVDNNAVAQQNQAQYTRHSMTANPWKDMLSAGTSAIAGRGGAALGSNIMGRITGGGQEEVQNDWRLPWRGIGGGA